MAVLMTEGEPVFFLRPPAGNHTWKKPDNESVYFSQVKEAT